MVVRLGDSKKGSVRPKTVGDNTINELIEAGWEACAVEY